MPLKTLFLNPPSFENFDGGAGSRWPATREIESYWYPVWLAYPTGMLEGARLLDAPPHHVSGEETIQIAKDYEFLVLFTSTPGFPGDMRLAKAIKDANPNIKICFRRAARYRCSRKSRCAIVQSIDFVARREFDYTVVEYAQGKPLEEIAGISYLKDGQIVHNPDRPQIEDLDRLPACHQGLQARSRCHALQHAVPAPSFCLALHHARMPCAVYVLPLAADFERTPVARALHRRRGRRNGGGQKPCPT